MLEVIGRREYRGHKPGDQFVTKLDPALQRGIDRGNVRVLAEVEPSIEHRDHGLPRDWPPREANASAATEATERSPLS